MIETDIFTETNTDSTRSLATIRRIESLSSIENADSIEVAQFFDLGWKVVVKKGEFSIGQMVVFFEVDSILPESTWSEFMRPYNFRVRTIKLRQQISQGLCIPLTEVLEDSMIGTGYVNPNMGILVDEGVDLTELLGVTKYNPPVRASGSVNGGRPKGNFPSFLVKTDETRIQNAKKILEKYRGQFFYATEKLDGSSMTVYIKNIDTCGDFGVCSRNLDLAADGGGDFWGTAIRLDLEEKLRSVGKNISIQGELIGPGIQGNKYNLKEKEFRAFNAFDIDTHSYYDHARFFELCAKLEIPTVPVVRIPSSSVWPEVFCLNHTLEELVTASTRKSALNPQVWAEGIVIRPTFEKYCNILHGRLSFKIISPEFLLKNKEA